MLECWKIDPEALYPFVDASSSSKASICDNISKPQPLVPKLDPRSKLSEPQDQIDQNTGEQGHGQRCRTIRVVIIDRSSFSNLQDSIGVHSSAIQDREQGCDGEASSRDDTGSVVW